MVWRMSTRLVRKPTTGFLEIRFLGADRSLMIDAEVAHQRQPAILQKYRIGQDARLEN